MYSWGSGRHREQKRGFPLQSASTGPTWSFQDNSSPQLVKDFTTRLKADMAAASCPEPAWHTVETRPPIPENLKKADHVFVRHGARRTPPLTGHATARSG